MSPVFCLLSLDVAVPLEPASVPLAPKSRTSDVVWARPIIEQPQLNEAGADEGGRPSCGTRLGFSLHVDLLLVHTHR